MIALDYCLRWDKMTCIAVSIQHSTVLFVGFWIDKDERFTTEDINTINLYNWHIKVVGLLTHIVFKHTYSFSFYFMSIAMRVRTGEGGSSFQSLISHPLSPISQIVSLRSTFFSPTSIPLISQLQPSLLPPSDPSSHIFLSSCPPLSNNRTILE